MLLRKSANNLDADALYQSESVNMWVGEFFTVDHVDRIVTFYQSTSRDLNYHPFKVSTLEAVLHNLGMLRHQACEDYKLRLVCFVDDSREITHGLKFVMKDGSMLTLSEWKETGDELAGRVESAIVRIPFYPIRDRVVFSLPKVKSVKSKLSPAPRKREKKKDTPRKE
jgi:hypothetical protein